MKTPVRAGVFVRLLLRPAVTGATVREPVSGGSPFPGASSRKMTQPLHRLRRFLRELRRRNVYQVAAAYLVAAFVVVQVAALAAGAFGFPDWFEPMVWVLTGLGFPLTLVVAWAFELTADGVRRTPDSEPVGDDREPGDEAGARSAFRVLAGIGLVAASAAGVWYLTGSGPRAPSSSPEAMEDRSVAVLPFETLGKPEPTAFTDGVHGDVLTRLANVSDLRVTSRTSVLRYRTPARSLPEIAEELDVRWIVRGEVQESDGQVQVNARLVNARTDRQVWADSYRRRLTASNLFEIQGDITLEITRALQAHLTSVERTQIERLPTESIDAYRSYIRGRALLDQQTEVGMRQAATRFRRAIGQDSTYSLAWSGLADALLYLAEYGHAPADSVLPVARRAVRRALALDSVSAEAHVSRAFLHAAEGNGPGLIRELRRAEELRPSYAQAYSILGWYYPLLGRASAGLESASRAVELDPFAPEAWVNVALGYLTTGRPDSALGPARHTRRLQSGYSTAPFYEAVALYEVGRPQEALPLLSEIELGWAPPAPRVTAALADLASGDSVPARNLLSALPESTEMLFYRGLLHAALGHRDAAFDAFRGIEGWGRSPLLGWPNVSLRYLYPGVLGALRKDPRYDELIRGINRSWGLSPDGSVPAP